MSETMSRHPRAVARRGVAAIPTGVLIGVAALAGRHHRPVTA
jgi:hypothetical protein